MKITILGKSCITSNGNGAFFDSELSNSGKGEIVFSPLKEVSQKPHPRYGRFDNYTKLGYIAISEVLEQSGLNQTEGKRPIGIIISSRYECLENDLAFYKTTIEEDGAFSSPNLFSYTLPGIVLGECAIYFKLTGPTFCVGESGEVGYNALKAALDIFQSGYTDTLVVGWLDYPPRQISDKDVNEEMKCGAIFVVLQARTPDNLPCSQKSFFYTPPKITKENNKEIHSLLDLFTD